MRWWRVAWPGLCATLTGVGLCRFAYASLIPFLIGSGLLTAADAAYLGAANLGGYLAGAAAAARLAAPLGIGRAIRAAFLLSVLGLAACILPWGFWWYLPWRFLVGATGGFLMVLAPTFVLSDAAAGERGRIGGVIYTGVGIGISFAGLVVTPLATLNMGWAWAALAAGSALAAGFSWRRWHGGPTVLPAARRRVRLGLSAFLVVLAFATDGGGFLPHSLFWVDFITRSLGRGASAGAFNWLLFGIGAALGPTIAGALGDGIGLGSAVILGFIVKAIAVLLPALITTTPFLAVSSLIVGALSPGLTALCAAWLTQLVAPPDQTRAWGLAIMLFGILQTGNAYVMSYAYERLGSYVPLFVVGSLWELLGAVGAIAALIAVKRKLL